MEKGIGRKYTHTKPPKISFTPEGIDDVEFKLSKLERVVEIMRDGIKKELDAFKDDIHAI